MKKIISLGILVVAVLAIGLVGAVVYYQLGFRQRAEVETEAIITVYYDAGLTTEFEQGAMFNWGPVGSGVHTMPLWIKNTGLVSCLLEFNYDQQQIPGDWLNYWDYDGSPLAPDAVLPVEITLELPGGIGSGVYEWDSEIRAWAAP